MIDAKDAFERAKNNFLSGLNCTQSVVEVFAEELGFDKTSVMCMAQPFGAGTCRMREICGTVNGIMFCLGMQMGKATGDKESKDAIYKVGQELAAKFREKNGSIICRELLGLVPMGTSENLQKCGKADSHQVSEPVSEERTAEYYKKRPCPELCGMAAQIFAEYLEENSRKAGAVEDAGE
ncbi:MAG: C_GCAxxG_C_C family protein [Treponema sp.]|nr:C_GCAxxG_C_C family protein [Candidatus Treponema equifaecale]